MKPIQTKLLISVSFSAKDKVRAKNIFCRVDGPKALLRLQCLLVMTIVIYDNFIKDFTCGPGEKKQSGREVGSGGLEGGLFGYTMAQCMDLCTRRPNDCRAYQYSRQRKQCKLLKDIDPAENTNYQDFVYCVIGLIIISFNVA